MRLLHVKSLELSSFMSDIPPYAILSHTWGPDEVLFKDIGHKAIREAKHGWPKVLRCCELAAQDGWEYIWIDTCCIDKSDPTELGEAINSMFRWYEEAEVCYAYLSDVGPQDGGLQTAPWKWQLRRSRWFKRGWTLQELLAPSALLFLNSAWDTIGSREEWAFEIEAATGILTRHLLDFKSCCIATKLSWAARRKTTREEDRAYSLLGLLGINMPLIYGEGTNAFIRLQHVLVARHNDETIFVWGIKWSSSSFILPSGDLIPSVDILASAPDAFIHSNGLVIQQFDQARRGFTVTNAGLGLTAELFEFLPRPQIGGPLPMGGLPLYGLPLYGIQLNCTWESPPPGDKRNPIVLFLTKDPEKPPSTEQELVFFRRRGLDLKHWGELSSVNKRSLGRRDILIARQEGKYPRDQPSAFVVQSRGRGGLSLAITHTFSWVPEEKEWTLKEISKVMGDRAICILEHQAVIWEMFGRHGLAGGCSILLKWAPRALTIGVFKRSFLDLENLRDVQSFLSSEQETPFPQSIDLSSGERLRLTATPKGSHRPLRRHEKNLLLEYFIEDQPQESFSSLLPTQTDPSEVEIRGQFERVKMEDFRF